MKRRTIDNALFHIGELYLFHHDNPKCPSSTSLWGMFDKALNNHIYLEHSTVDLSHFQLYHILPQQYIFYRRATRSELRDYMYNLGVWESAI